MKGKEAVWKDEYEMEKERLEWKKFGIWMNEKATDGCSLFTARKTPDHCVR